MISTCQLPPDALLCKTLNKIYKESKRLSPFKSLLSLLSLLWLHSGAQSEADSTGCSKWLMKMAGGLLCLPVLQLIHTVLNMTLGSTDGVVSLWALCGRHDYWSEWQIKAGNWAGGWRKGVMWELCVGSVCTEKKNIAAWSKIKCLPVLQQNVGAFRDYDKE